MHNPVWARRWGVQKNMSRTTLMTLLVIIVSLLLAVALFIAGAIWRGRTTARLAATDSRKCVMSATLAHQDRGIWKNTRLRSG